MIQRERASSGESDLMSGLAASRSAAAHPESLPSTPKHRAPAWEDLYRAIGPEQQRELLSLAQRQGVLYTHQLPAIPNGTAVEARQPLLGRLLSGAITELISVHPEPVDVDDNELDAGQREAVAKALATPEIFLLQGVPGSGKSRVVAEIIIRAAAKGERVLLLAATPAAVDRVLERLAAKEAVFPVRCVGPGENLEALPAAIRALTFVQRVRSLHLHALDCARRQTEADQQRSRRLRQDEPRWVEIEELASRGEVLEAERQAFLARRRHLADDVSRQADLVESGAGEGFERLVADVRHAHTQAAVDAQTRLAVLRDRIDTARQEQGVLDAELHALQPLVEAKQQARWWTTAWWRASLRGKDLGLRWADGQERRTQIQAQLDSLGEQQSLLTAQLEEAERLFQRQRTDLIAAEVARREGELDDREAALAREQSILEQKWQNLSGEFAADTPRPAAMTAQAVREARSTWLRLVEQTEAQSAFAQQWAVYLEQTPEALQARLPGYVNLVAGTIAALHRDEHYGDAATAAGPDFDLLVLEDADQITEAELLPAARRARRWVLVGEFAWPYDTGPVSARHNAPAHEPAGTAAGGRAVAQTPSRPGVFQRLWQTLHCDPRRLPYNWLMEGKRLCCRLRPLAPEQRQWLSTEHVADFPDIELRILTPPGGQPVLGEIVFPPAFTIERAKQYIFEELEELAVLASGSSLRWIDEEDRLILRLADRDLTHGPAVDLVPGIREILGSATSASNGSHAHAPSWQTCCLEFARASGWDRPRATEWLQRHLGLRDLGRSVCLTVCYRMDANLARLVSDLLSAGGPGGGATARVAIHGTERNGSAASIEFVPVPALGASGRAMPLPRKGGAGLELELADPRQRERLPADLRAVLPNHGFVNYPEAQAVVRTLVGLSKEFGDRRPVVAVLAVYPAQAELIRRLLRLEPALVAQQVPVDVPAAFRQREADVVLLSLTRSHTHRPVAFGEGPQMLALALTRARAKLILFGDPGTLVRRSQWEGPLEHLDEDAAARERQLVTRLVHALQAGGAEPQATPVCQGSGK